MPVSNTVSDTCMRSTRTTTKHQLRRTAVRSGGVLRAMDLLLPCATVDADVSDTPSASASDAVSECGGAILCVRLNVMSSFSWRFVGCLSFAKDD